MKTFLIATFAVVLLSLAAVSKADTSFETGADWQISLNSGGSYGPPDALSSRPLPDGDMVTGIEGGNPFNISDRWYRYTFTLSELTLAATAQFVTNDLFELLVNGNLVDLSLVVNGGTLNANDQSPLTGLPIPGSDFQLGSNEIIFKTHSFTGGGAGDPFLAARIDISAVPEPSTCGLMLLSSCAVLAARRFRCASTR